MSEHSSQLVRQAASPTQGHQDSLGPEPCMFNTPDHSLRASDLGNAQSWGEESRAGVGWRGTHRGLLYHMGLGNSTHNASLLWTETTDTSSSP